MKKIVFERVQLIEAHNSVYSYDLISLCETSLNDQIDIPDPLLDGYKFISCNHPSGNRRGGVGLFYREDFPLLVRDDLSFDESIVCEITLDRKKNLLYSFVSESKQQSKFPRI